MLLLLKIDRKHSKKPNYSPNNFKPKKPQISGKSINIKREEEKGSF
jgi:hypothetical protein